MQIFPERIHRKYKITGNYTQLIQCINLHLLNFQSANRIGMRIFSNQFLKHVHIVDKICTHTLEIFYLSFIHDVVFPVPSQRNIIVLHLYIVHTQLL